jgi:hypothetical protein
MARPTIGAPIPAANQRTQVVATGATAGKFNLRVQGRGGTLDVTTGDIQFNDTANTVRDRLDAVLNPLGIDVTTVSGGPLPAAVVVEFVGGEAFTVTVTGSTLVNGTAVVSTPQAATGAVFPVGPYRTAGPNMKSSSMARPRPLGQGGR